METATENKVGYKKTKLGWIPEDWKIAQVKDVCTVKGRIGFRGYTTEDIVEIGEGAITLSPSNIKSDKLDFTNNTYISWFKYEESPEIQLETNDIVLVKTGSSFGKVAIVKELPEKTTVNPQIVVLKKIKCNPDYLYSTFANAPIQKQITSTVVGGAIPTLSQENILNFIIPLPPLPEQQKIAAILSTWGKAIDKLTRLIAANEQRKKGLMQILLTGKKRFAGFTEEWKEVKLREIAILITKGTTPTSVGFNFETVGINFIKAENLNEVGEIIIDQTPKISEECDQVLRRSRLEDGDMLFSIAGTLGRTAIVKSVHLPANTNQALSIIRMKNQNTEYIQFQLNSTRVDRFIQQMVAVGAQPNINLQQVGNIKIPFPSSAEQQKIASTLSAADKEIELLKQELSNLQQQKKGLMQKLLTGEVRVKI